MAATYSVHEVKKILRLSQQRVNSDGTRKCGNPTPNKWDIYIDIDSAPYKVSEVNPIMTLTFQVEQCVYNVGNVLEIIVTKIHPW